METTTQHASRSLDVTGLSGEAIRTVETLVALLRGQQPTQPRLGGTITFSSRDEWRKAIREWAESHQPIPNEADWSRESIYEGCGE